MCEYAKLWRDAAPRRGGLRAVLRSACRHAYLSLLAALDRSDEDRFLRCMYCHYVFDDQREGFRTLMRKLMGSGTFVDTDTCIRMLRGESPIEGRCYHLSFDDGFRNCFTNALPVLHELGIPALFFVPPGLIHGESAAERERWMSATAYRAPIEILRWDDLEEMIARGYEVGSHTRRHVRLSAISDDPRRLEDEIAGSKADLEERLGIECRYISWPYGRRRDVDRVSLEAVRRAGYHACFGGHRGTVRPGRTDAFRIPRHHFEVQWPVSHVRYFLRGRREAAG